MGSSLDNLLVFYYITHVILHVCVHNILNTVTLKYYQPLLCTVHTHVYKLFYKFITGILTVETWRFSLFFFLVSIVVLSLLLTICTTVCTKHLLKQEITQHGTSLASCCYSLRCTKKTRNNKRQCCRPTIRYQKILHNISFAKFKQQRQHS